MLSTKQVRLVESIQKHLAQPVEGMELPRARKPSDIIPLTDIQQRHVHSIAKHKRGASSSSSASSGVAAAGTDPRDYYRGRRNEAEEVARQQEEMPTIGGGEDSEDDDDEGDEREDEEASMAALPTSTDEEHHGSRALSELTVLLNDDDTYTYSNGVSIDPAKYRPIYHRANQALFNYLDEFHVDIEDTGDHTFQYNASDVTVVNKMEIPVAVNIANSEIKFEFKTQEGDIGFGVVFASYAEPAEGEEEKEEYRASNRDPMEFSTLYAERIMQSDIPDKPITGAFTVDEAGVLFFLFNNEHEWIADKHVSYQIDVLSPAFTQPDYERCAISMPLLDDCLGDLSVARDRHVEAVDCIDHYSGSVQNLEDAICKLENDVKGLHDEWSEASEKLNRAAHALSRLNEVKPGLCIRTLQKRELYHLLMYIPEEASLVCKYWSDLVCNHGLNYSDRSHLLDNSPRRRRISANNRETAALPMPGKAVAPRRRYPGLVSGIGSISSHGIGQASLGAGGAGLKTTSSHGGATGMTGDSLWASDDDDEYEKEQEQLDRQASGTLTAPEEKYGTDDFRSIYGYDEGPRSTLEGKGKGKGKDRGKGKSKGMGMGKDKAKRQPGKPSSSIPSAGTMPASASTGHLAPHGYKPEDYASLYGAPNTGPASISAQPRSADPISHVPASPSPSAARAGHRAYSPAAVTEGPTDAAGAEKKEDDRIVVTNARTKTPSPSPAHTYNYQGKGKAKAKQDSAPSAELDPRSTAGEREQKQHDDDDEDSLDGVGTPAKPLAKSSAHRQGVLGQLASAGKPDPAEVVRRIDACFAQDVDFEAQRAALKQKLSVWCQIFEEKRRRPPTVKEKRRLTKDLYAAYQETRVQQSRNFEEINGLLGSIGMSLNEYRRLGEPEE